MNQPKELTLTDMVFEHRNRAYGAYELRSIYKQTITRAIIIGVSLFLFALISLMLFAKISPTKTKYREVTADVLNFPKEKEKIPLKPMLDIEKPKEQVEAKRFVPIIIVEDTDPIDEPLPPQQSDLDDSKIGTVDVHGKGTDLILEEEPPKTKGVENKVFEIEDNTVHNTVNIEIQPSFVGGITEMYKFLSKNLNYPAAAQHNNTQGKVFLSFVIEKDGSLSNLEVLKGIGMGCDEEAMRVIKMMPKWKAGSQQGNPVRVKFTLPIVFTLNE